MSNFESRRLERVATAFHLIMEQRGHPIERDTSREIARAVLKVFYRPRQGEPVAWQARLKSGEGDWFQVEYPDRHNSPEIFEYRPLYAAPL